MVASQVHETRRVTQKNYTTAREIRCRGALIRIAPNEISVAIPSAIKRIYGEQVEMTRKVCH